MPGPLTVRQTVTTGAPFSQQGELSMVPAPQVHMPKSFSNSHRPSSPLIRHPKSNDLTRRGDIGTPRGDGVEGGSCKPRRRQEGPFPRASRWRGPGPRPHPDSGLGTLGIIRKPISLLQAV